MITYWPVPKCCTSSLFPCPSIWRSVSVQHVCCCPILRLHYQSLHLFSLGPDLTSEPLLIRPYKRSPAVSWSCFLSWNLFTIPALSAWKVYHIKPSCLTIPIISQKHSWTISSCLLPLCVGPESTGALKRRLCLSLYQVEVISINMIFHMSNPMCLTIGSDARTCVLPRDAKADSL